jgi:hypothetical protein
MHVDLGIAGERDNAGLAAEGTGGMERFQRL